MQLRSLLMVIVTGLALVACGDDSREISASKNMEKAGEAAGEALENTAEAVSDTMNTAGEMAEDAADATMEAASDAIDKAGDMASEAADATRETAGAIADAAEKAVEKTKANN